VTGGATTGVTISNLRGGYDAWYYSAIRIGQLLPEEQTGIAGRARRDTPVPPRSFVFRNTPDGIDMQPKGCL